MTGTLLAFLYAASVIVYLLMFFFDRPTRITLSDFLLVLIVSLIPILNALVIVLVFLSKYGDKVIWEKKE